MSAGERAPKIHHVDFYPADYLDGVARLNAEEQGIYWCICSLIYRHGGHIDNDAVWIARHFEGGHWRRIAKVIHDLVQVHGKLVCEGGKLSSAKCGSELSKAQTRVAQATQNGARGGRPAIRPDPAKVPQGGVARPPAKVPQGGVAEGPQEIDVPADFNGLAKPAGSVPRNLSTNYQSPSTKDRTPESPSDSENPERRNTGNPASNPDPERAASSSAPASPERDLASVIWKQVVAKARSRSLVGKWVKKYDYGLIVDCHLASERRPIGDYVSWMEAALQTRDGKRQAQQVARQQEQHEDPIRRRQPGENRDALEDERRGIDPYADDQAHRVRRPAVIAYRPEPPPVVVTAPTTDTRQ